MKNPHVGILKMTIVARHMGMAVHPSEIISAMLSLVVCGYAAKAQREPIGVKRRFFASMPFPKCVHAFTMSAPVDICSATGEICPDADCNSKRWVEY
jgi:hypothetical protein